MPGEFFLARQSIRRRRDEQRIGAGVPRRRRQLVAAFDEQVIDAGDHGQPARGALHREIELLDPLFLRQGKEFARRAADDYGVNAVFRLPVDDSPVSIEVDRQVVPERRDDRRSDPLELHDSPSAAASFRQGRSIRFIAYISSAA